MRVYELGFILKPDLPHLEVQAAIEAVKEWLAAGGATIDKVDDWGKRRLAYRVQGFWNGHYVFVQYSLKDGFSITSEVERRMRVTEKIIKYMTIRIDEDLKRLAKAKVRRDKRAPRLAAKLAARQAAEEARQKPKAPGPPAPAPAPEPPATAPEAGTT